MCCGDSGHRCCRYNTLMRSGQLYGGKGQFGRLVDRAGTPLFEDGQPYISNDPGAWQTVTCKQFLWLCSKPLATAVQYRSVLFVSLYRAALVINLNADFSSLLPKGNKVYQITHFEDPKPAASYFSVLHQDLATGKLTAVSTQCAL